MSFNTEVANLALLHLGVSNKTIANLETERSAEANVCRMFYDRALESVLRDYSWPFATTFAVLNLIEENPNDEWLFSYQYPSDCVRMKRILSGIVEVTAQDRIVYKLASKDSGKIILTNQEKAQLEYVRKIDDPNLMTPDFIMAFSFKLAHYMAPSLTGGDPFKLGERAKNNYLEEISEARSNAFNEEQSDTTNESEFTRSRT